jgi:hypothetical protein
MNKGEKNILSRLERESMGGAGRAGHGGGNFLPTEKKIIALNKTVGYSRLHIRGNPLEPSGAALKPTMGRFAMKTAIKMGLGLAVVLGFLTLAQAEDAKEKTLKGTITCAKCDLGIAAKCNTVVKVKDTVYWFDKTSNGKYHKDTCKAAKEGTVTGTVSEKDGKKWVNVSKVEYK